MHRLNKIFSKKIKLTVGLMSGTSMDGVDAALVEIQNQGLQTELELVHFLTLPYPDGLKEKILEYSTPGQGSVDQICRLNVLLGEIFADAVKALLGAADAKPEQVDFIGSHGQTVQHLPAEKELFDYKIRASLQLGEPSVIAKRTGILTVADFRPADLALGGQGAPLVPYFDFIMFRSKEKNRGLLNIGGIANFTILKKNGKLEEIMAFDTGPGNMVIDGLMQKLFNQPFDKDGKIAQTGTVSQELLQWAFNHPYFKKPPPKSTGREEFGDEFCERFLAQARQFNLKRNDIIATAAELTSHSVWASYRKFVAPQIAIDEVIVSGGGSDNLFIMESLRQKALGMRIKRIDEFGIPAEAKEAVCFAILANETLCGNNNNVPGATGASHPTILGKICL
ncbi:MAG: anhydro-N-acetylmuramic acid kinase [bacterium]